MESILKSIRKTCNIPEDSTTFDTDLIMQINTAFMNLTQMGVGPTDGFIVKGEYEKWSDFISEDDKKHEGVKTYVFLKTKLVFDPPPSSTVLQSYNETIKELEWRLNVAAETKADV